MSGLIRKKRHARPVSKNSKNENFRSEKNNSFPFSENPTFPSPFGAFTTPSPPQCLPLHLPNALASFANWCKSIEAFEVRGKRGGRNRSGVAAQVRWEILEAASQIRLCEVIVMSLRFPYIFFRRHFHATTISRQTGLISWRRPDN